MQRISLRDLRTSRLSGEALQSDQSVQSESLQSIGHCFKLQVPVC